MSLSKKISKVVSMALLVAMMQGCVNEEVSQSGLTESTKNEYSSTESTKLTESNEIADSDSKEVAESEIHFISTGNSDAILVKQGDAAVVIDGADNNDENMLVSYLEKVGVKTVPLLVATHFDADHIGSLDSILDSYDVEKVLIPNGDADTKTYKDFVTSIANNGVGASVPLLNSEFEFGSGVFKVLSVANTNDRNNNSIVLEYRNGSDSVLLTGDADLSILNNIDVKDVDLLKVSHHGSRTGTDESFIKRLCFK